MKIYKYILGALLLSGLALPLTNVRAQDVHLKCLEWNVKALEFYNNSISTFPTITPLYPVCFRTMWITEIFFPLMTGNKKQAKGAKGAKATAKSIGSCRNQGKNSTPEALGLVQAPRAKGAKRCKNIHLF